MRPQNAMLYSGVDEKWETVPPCTQRTDQTAAASAFFWARRLRTRYLAETILGLSFLSAITALYPSLALRSISASTASCIRTRLFACLHPWLTAFKACQNSFPALSVFSVAGQFTYVNDIQLPAFLAADNCSAAAGPITASGALIR